MYLYFWWDYTSSSIYSTYPVFNRKRGFLFLSWGICISNFKLLPKEHRGKEESLKWGQFTKLFKNAACHYLDIFLKVYRASGNHTNLLQFIALQIAIIFSASVILSLFLSLHFHFYFKRSYFQTFQLKSYTL